VFIQRQTLAADGGIERRSIHFMDGFEMASAVDDDERHVSLVIFFILRSMPGNIACQDSPAKNYSAEKLLYYRRVGPCSRSLLSLACVIGTA
jgi:hypothetical protein